MYTFIINDNNLKIKTNLIGGSDIDVSKLVIDNFDVSKNNLYLFKNPDYEFNLDQKNKNSEYWKTIPEDHKEILLKEYISSEEYNKVNPAQDENKLYEVIEDAKYATLNDRQIENFNSDFINRNLNYDDDDFEEDDEEDEEETRKKARDDFKREEEASKKRIIDNVQAAREAEKRQKEEGNNEEEDDAEAVNAFKIVEEVNVNQSGEEQVAEQKEYANDGTYVGVGGGIPTSEAITNLFGDDTSPPAIVRILEEFNWGEDHIMVNDIKVRIPESYDEWFAKQTENMKKFVADNKLSLDLIRFSNLLRNNYQFYNPNFQLEKPVPDSETGVKYNGLVEKVDIEALQQLVKESHMRFRLHVQEFFGTLGLNPGIEVEISQLGGFSKNLHVTEEQLNGGMIPMLVPFSLVSKVPNFIDDIESKLKDVIRVLKSKGLKLVGDSENEIFKAVKKVKHQEKQLEVLANSLERIAKDPTSEKVVTMEEVLKYSNKLEKGQIRGLDVVKNLATVELTTNKR